MSDGSLGGKRREMFARLMPTYAPFYVAMSTYLSSLVHRRRHNAGIPRRCGSRFDELDDAVLATDLALHSRIDQQGEIIAELRAEMYDLIGQREECFGRFLERLEGVSAVFTETVREMRQEW